MATRPRPWQCVGIVAIAVGVVAGCGGDDTRSFPPLQTHTDLTAQSASFVGAESCASCHQEPYDSWAESTHGRAGGLPSEVPILAPFDGSEIRFQDAVVRAIHEAGEWWFEVEWSGEQHRFQVDGVVGAGAMLGGGTQGFVTKAEDGTVRFLPFDWSVAEATWFCNTGGREDQGWIPITSDMRLRDCADWPLSRILGNHGRFQNCQSCHGSQIEVSFTADAGYETSWTSLRVECEACHGPASDHLEWANQPNAQPDQDIGIRSLTALSEDESLAVCLACHGLKSVLQPGYRTGEPGLEDHMSLGMAVLDQQPYLPDGRVATFAYQGTHRSSACYLSGTMDCVSCHQPHGQGYWDINRKDLASPFDDGQCTACHAAKTVAPQEHTQHQDVRCVSCHMPYVQHPAVGSAVGFARSDHTISNPRPGLDGQFGIVGACGSCHSEQSSTELADDLERLWGESPVLRPVVAQLLARSSSVEDPAPSASEDRSELLQPDVFDPVAQVAGLGSFLESPMEPNEEERQRLWQLSENSDVDVAAIALAVLHLWTPEAHDERTRLIAALDPQWLDTHGHRDEPLRRRWVAALTHAGDKALEARDAGRAATAYGAGLELLPDQTFLLQATGLLLRAAGQTDASTAFLDRAAQSADNQALVLVTIALGELQRGELDQARDRIDLALTANPWEPMAHYVSGQIHLATGAPTEAMSALERAIELDAGHLPSWEALAQALDATGRSSVGARQRIADLQPNP